MKQFKNFLIFSIIYFNFVVKTNDQKSLDSHEQEENKNSLLADNQNNDFKHDETNRLKNSTEVKEKSADKKDEPNKHILIVGDDGYEQHIKSFDENLKLSKERISKGLNEEAKESLKAAKENLNFIEKNGQRDIDENVPLRAYFAAKEYFPNDKIYENNDTAKNEFIILLKNKAAEIDQLQNDIDKINSKNKEQLERLLTNLKNLNIDNDFKLYVEAFISKVHQLLKDPEQIQAQTIKKMERFYIYLKNRIMKLDISPFSQADKNNISNKYLVPLKI